MRSINVETGKIDKEFTLNRSYACSGCVNYYDDTDTVCKRGCKYYFRKLEPTPRILRKGNALSDAQLKCLRDRGDVVSPKVLNINP